MKKLILSLIVVVTLVFKSFSITPDEGMWLPMFVARLNYVDMQKMGLHLTADEIYSVNHSCLKDAIVSLGFFCTAEVVSNEGLIFTNHHCGYDAIQSNSTLEHDYLTNGFWAASKQEELSNEGLTASFLVRMEDVTAKVLADVKTEMTETERLSKIHEASLKIEKTASEKNKYEATVKSFYDGNEYYLFVYETYKDVRLVGAPPSSIGKFGGDTDNWMWPRHTGDFSIFRIYTAPDGTSAEYSKENIPLKPKYSLPISLKGIKRDDFAMVWGYPGQTQRFLTSYGVKLAIGQSNPAVVEIRTKKLAIIKEFMEKSPKIKLQYSSKYSECSNYWKYYIGQTKGLKRLNIFERKLEQESSFAKWANENSERKEKYGYALANIEEGYDELKKYNLSNKYLEEAVLQGPEIIFFAFGTYELYSLLKKSKGYEDAIKISASEFKETAKQFFKDYYKPCDQKLFAELLKMYYDNVPQDQHPSIFKNVVKKKYKGNFYKFAEAVYSKSIFADSVKLYQFLAKPTFKVIDKDLGFMTMMSMMNIYINIYTSLNSVQGKIDNGNRLYIAGLREMNSGRKYYPDANSTMRMSYGKISDYYPSDAVHYDYLTTIDGIIGKEDISSDEFFVPQKLKELWKTKDYGKYADSDGRIDVCFIANLDITGGNSGSPVINGDGQLIGIAFDGNWEAMSGDIAYEPELQRTICVDIRYVLFIIDKFAGAQNIINELTIVQ